MKAKLKIIMGKYSSPNEPFRKILVIRTNKIEPIMKKYKTTIKERSPICKQSKNL
jgi:hypothetical protein